MSKSRYLENAIEEVCFSVGKMAFVSGPRQCGKTTMARTLLKQRGIGQYYNWDETKFRRLWTKDPTQIIPSSNGSSGIKPLIVLDEIHKAKLWKRSLKGVYDSSPEACDILVTGSAKLNVYRRGSDSLLGRYHHFRLHPFSLAELASPKQSISHEKLLEHLFDSDFVEVKNSAKYLQLLDKFGPFPEPLLSEDSRTLNLWHRGRVEKIVREDLRDLSRLPELSQIEMLVSLLPERAANVLSLQALSEDLEVAYTTLKRWMGYLYALYYAFKIQPYFKSLPRSLKKEGKLYLWDWSEIEDPGHRFENLVASHLLKYCDYLTDTGEGDFQLCYLRNKQKKEIDFLIVKDNKPWLPVEVKLNDESLSDNWSVFMKYLDCNHGVQLVKNENVRNIKNTHFGKILTISASQFLACLV
ncbi:MAG: ATP-binding protein [Gammaproteobacteria bacterium]